MQNLIELNEALTKLKTNGCTHLGYLLYHQQLQSIDNRVYLTEAQFRECHEKDSGEMWRTDGHQE